MRKIFEIAGKKSENVAHRWAGAIAEAQTL
jgi:hypothetical protein